MMRGKALLVVHQKGSYPGRIGTLLMERGYALDVRCPNLGHSLPEDLGEYAVCGLFGGPMSANDCHMPGIRAELDWLPKVLEADRPFLGICLGAQMLSRVLGGTVCPHPEAFVEIGYSQIRPTEAGQDLFPAPMHVYQWHKEGFSVPESCDLLATGSVFPNQAFRFGRRAYGVQFHPEVTLAMKQMWSVSAAHMLNQPGAQPAELHVSLHTQNDPPLDRWANRFIDLLLAEAGDEVCAARCAQSKMRAASAPEAPDASSQPANDRSAGTQSSMQSRSSDTAVVPRTTFAA